MMSAANKKQHFIRKIVFYALISALIFLKASAYSDDNITAEEILLKSDDARNPQIDYTLHSKVTSYKLNREPQIATFEVMIKGEQAKAIVRTLTPAVDKGRTMLMVGKELWAYIPDVSKPLRISFQQRLIGQIANGDVARVNFSGDYTPELTRIEPIDGKEYYVLNLTAKTEDVTYSRAVLWVEKETLHPLKAEFYAISGRLLKTCAYENYKVLGGRLRPERLVMSDPIVKGEYSIVDVQGMTVGPLSDKYFTKDYMKKLIE